MAKSETLSLGELEPPRTLMLSPIVNGVESVTCGWETSSLFSGGGTAANSNLLRPSMERSRRSSDFPLTVRFSYRVLYLPVWRLRSATSSLYFPGRAIAGISRVYVCLGNQIASVGWSRRDTE